MAEVIVHHFLEPLQNVLQDADGLLFGDFASFGEEGPEVTSIAELLDDVLVVAGPVLVEQPAGVFSLEGRQDHQLVFQGSLHGRFTHVVQVHLLYGHVLIFVLIRVSQEHHTECTIA